MKIIPGLILILLISACSNTAEKPPYPGIKLGKAYEISGRWYKPHYDASYDEIGEASWYGPGFHGGHTASGERFDQDALTAAHRTLPLPCIVRVTNLANGKSAIIKINDRGPFARDRIIDLSRGSARKLGITGTAKVRVQFLEKETKEYAQNSLKGTSYAMRSLKKVDPEQAGIRQEAMQQPQLVMETKMFEGSTAPHYDDAPDIFSVVDTTNAAPALSHNAPGANVLTEPVPETIVIPNQPQFQPVTALNNNHKFIVQVGTFSIRGNAENLISRLTSLGIATLTEVNIHDKPWYRVTLGEFDSQEDAKNILSKLPSLGIANARIIRN